jgi:hypothetical protein
MRRVASISAAICRRIVSHQVPTCVQRHGQNCFQRLRSLHMKPWIIAALICSASAAYAAEDDNKIHPTCVEENNTRRCWVDQSQSYPRFVASTTAARRYSDAAAEKTAP